MLFLLRIIILSSMLCFFQGNTYASTGQVNIIPSPPTVVAPNTAFNITGNYVLLIDTVPSNAGRDCGFYSIAPPVFSPSYWDWIFWSGEYATLHYSIDGVDRGQIGLVGYSRGINPSSDLGKTLNFSVPINTSGMQPGSVHTASVFIQDTYAAGCYYVGWYLSWGRAIGPVIAIATHQFTIANPTPNISINLGKPSLTPCDTEIGKITVTSNDPAPNGGTVSLTFPDGTTASATFAGKTATLTFADFGLPNGYLDGGAHPAGSTLNFTASVTTTAGQTASATATANVIAGGLNVTVVPTKTSIEPNIHWCPDAKNPKCRRSQKLSARSTPLNINVQDSSGLPVVGANISLTVERVSTKFGGHNHDTSTVATSTRPLGSISKVADKGQGLYTATYTATEFSSEDKVRAKVDFQGCSANVVSPPITAQIFGLSWLQVPAPHVAIGGTVAHHGPNNKNNPTTPDNNHWVTLKTNNTMSYLMTLYSLSYGAGLYINDASLPFGGKFDVNGRWVERDHKTHRRGIDIDMRLYDTANTASNETVLANFKALEKTHPESLAPFISYKIHSKKTLNKHLHVYFW